MVSYNCALDNDTAFLVGHHHRPGTITRDTTAILAARGEPIWLARASRTSGSVARGGVEPGALLVADADLECPLQHVVGNYAGSPHSRSTSPGCGVEHPTPLAGQRDWM